MKLKAFSALTSKTAFVSFVANMSYIACAAALYHVSCPPNSGKLPTAFV